MCKKSPAFRVSVYILAFLFSTMGFASAANSIEIIGTETLVEQQRLVDTQQKLREALGRDEVRAMLVKYGVSLEEADARVAALTQQEAQKLAAEFDNMPAGGDAVLLLLIIILILLLR